MPEAVKEINSLLTTLDNDDYTIVINYIKIIAEKRKKQRALETIIAMNEFESVLNGDKGWKNEQEMLDDMAEFRRERLGIPA
mgnify:FL=1